jgi:formylglycine-generating enzyme
MSRISLVVAAALCLVGCGREANEESILVPADSGSSSPESGGGGGSGGDDASSCTPGVTRCSGASEVQSCGATGQWGAPWPCATGTCSGGVCMGSTTTGTSCQNSGDGLSNCGANSESCCTSLEVAGGKYYRTYDPIGADGGVSLAADGGPSGEADPATVSGFRLDKYLVTVGRFRQFVAAWNGGAGYTPPAGSGKHVHLNNGNGLNATIGGYEPGWVATDDSNIALNDTNLACDPMQFFTIQEPFPVQATWTATPGAQETLPIDCVNSYEAYAFCIWDGGFLPSEAEWVYAAAGGSQQREYPWGSMDPGTSNQYAIYACNYPSGSGTCTLGDAGVGAPNIAPVGTAMKGAGLWGQLDLAGNLWEWNLDWEDAYADPCTDCADVTADGGIVGDGLFRIVGGGSFLVPDALSLLPPRRIVGGPAPGDVSIGFRCARTP